MKLLLQIPCAAILLSACVTINIYFPASAAEKAADKIIDEVWQMRGDAARPDVAEPPASTTKEKP